MYNDLRGHGDYPPASGSAYDHHLSHKLCPSDASPASNRFYAGYATANYVAVHGGGIKSVSDDLEQMGNGAFSEASSVSFGDIANGSANTFLLGERSFRLNGTAGAIWMRSVNANGDGGDGTAVAGICDRSATINDFTNREGFSSSHLGGTHFVMADGSVRFCDETIDADVYENLATIKAEKIASDNPGD